MSIFMNSSLIYLCWGYHDLTNLPPWHCARYTQVIPVIIQANLILFNQQYHAMPIRSPFCGWMGFLKLRGLQASVPLLAPPPPALWSILLSLSLQFVRSQNAGKLFVLELLLCRLTEQGLKCPGSTYESSPLVAIFRRCELVIFLIPISCLVNKVLKL